MIKCSEIIIINYKKGALISKILLICFLYCKCQVDKGNVNDDILIDNKQNQKNGKKELCKNDLTVSNEEKCKNIEKKASIRIIDSGKQNKTKNLEISNYKNKKMKRNVHSNEFYKSPFKEDKQHKIHQIKKENFNDFKKKIKQKIAIPWEQYKLIKKNKNKDEKRPNLINKGLYINFYCYNCKNDNWKHLGTGYFNVARLINMGEKCNFCKLLCINYSQNCDFKLLGMHNCSYHIEMNKFIDQNKLPCLENLEYIEEKGKASENDKLIVLNTLGRLSYFEVNIH